MIGCGIMKSKFIKLFAEKKFLIILLVIYVVILISVHVVRGNFLIGEEAYFNSRIANQFLETGEIVHDDFSYGGRNLLIPLAFPLVLAGFSALTGTTVFFAAKAIPFILGFFSIILFYLILTFFKVNERVKLFSLIFLLLSPTFLYLFITSTKFSSVIFLSFLGFYLLLKNRKILAAISFILIPLLNLLLSYFIFFILFFYVLKQRKNLRWYFLVLFLTFSIVFTLYGYGVGYRPEVPFKSLISDFGGQFGLSIFSVTLSFIGLGNLWRRKYRNFLVYLVFVVLLISSLYYVQNLFLFNFLVVVLAAYGLNYLVNRSWSSFLIKRFTLFILLLGVLFSGISYINILEDVRPDQQDIKVLRYLEDVTGPGDMVFSHYSMGNWISGIAHRRNFMDSNFINAPSLEKRLRYSDVLFYSRDRQLMISILEEYDIDYIWIDYEMIRELDLDNRGGLLLLFLYDDRFENLYNRDGIEIWKFNG